VRMHACVYMCVSVCVCVCVCVRAKACMHAYMYACLVCLRVHVLLFYNCLRVLTRLYLILFRAAS